MPRIPRGLVYGFIYHETRKGSLPTPAQSAIVLMAY